MSAASPHTHDDLASPAGAGSASTPGQLSARPPGTDSQVLSAGTGDMPPLPRPLPARVADLVDDLLTPLEALPLADCDSAPTISGYEIVGLLGRGGMGVVYKAQHLPLRRMVALKMIRTGPNARPEELARFHSEAEAVAALQHPGIVQIYEVGEHCGQPYCALEFVAGGSLAQYLAGKPRPAVEAARLVESVARAVQYAHEHGVIHRDLKPANILLSGVGSQEPVATSSTADACPPCDSALWTPKISDFGLAKRLQSDTGHTHTGQLLGTPCYMAPELATGTVSPAADIYALGAILYEMVTGRPPFQGVTAEDTVRLAEAEEPVPPSRLQSQVPPDLETIALKCLRKEPSRRYITPGDLADDLTRFLAGEPIRARPVSSWERGVKWAQRRPATATLLATSVLLLAGLVGGGLWHNAQLWAAREDLKQALGQVTVERDEANRLRTQADAARDQAQKGLLQAAILGERLAEVSNIFLRGVPGTARIRRELVEELEKVHAQCLQETGGGPAVEQVRGRLLWRLGLLYQDLGEYGPAEQVLRSALDLFGRLHAADPADSGHLHDLAYSHHNIAVLLQRRDPSAPSTAAEDHYRTALRFRRDLIARQPDQPDHGCDLGKHLNNLGEALRDRGQYPQAQEAHTGAVAALTPLVAAYPDRTAYRQVLALNYHNLGRLNEVWSRRDSSESASHLRRAEESYRQAAEERRTITLSPSHTREARRDLAASLNRWAATLASLKQTDRQEEVLRAVVDQRQKQVEEFPTVAEYQRDLGGALNNLAIVLRNRGQTGEALPLLRQAIRYQDVALRLDPGDNLAREFLRNHYGSLTQTLVTTGDHAEAAVAVEKLISYFPDNPLDPYYAARYLARCAALVVNDPHLDADQRTVLRQTYVERAMGMLGRARANGFKNVPGALREQPNLTPLDHPDLAPLRERTDFQKLRAEPTVRSRG